jgi:transcriptional regulator PpsR
LSRRDNQPADLGALSGCAAGLARAFVSLSSDIALVIDEAGIVTAVAQNEQSPMSAAAQQWVGRHWAETVTGDTRSKIESLLADATTGGLGRRREVNLASEPGTELPVAYTALRLGERGPVLAVGRDLRSMAAIQQRFLETQAALERSYWRARHDEVRHRLLYQVATDAVLTVDAHDQCVVALNASAMGLLQADGGGGPGRPLPPQFDARSRPAVAALLERALAGHDPVEGLARLAGSHVTLNLVATRLPGAHGSSLVLLRLRRADPPQDDPLAVGSALARHVDGTAEAIVVTDALGQVREANLAFVQMTQAADVAALLGQPLERWLPGTGQAVVRKVYTQGLALHERVTLCRRDATRLPLDMAGALLADVAGGDAGFTLRPCGTDTLAADARAAALVQAIDALAAELGHVALPDLLQQAQLLARRHLVLTAIDRHAGDPVAAARLLGISLEQLSELRRDTGPDTAPHPR